MAQNLPRGTPARVLVLLSLLTGLVTVSVWRDALQRPGHTWVRYPTALGDTGLLKPGQLPVNLETPGGRVVLSAGGTPLRRGDHRMFRVRTEMEPMLPFTLFTTVENLAATPDPKLYARTAPHEFLKLRAQVLDPAAPNLAPVRPVEPTAPGLAIQNAPVLPQLTFPPVNPGMAVEEGRPDPLNPPQVPPGEDPDQVLALPAPGPRLPKPLPIPVPLLPDSGGENSDSRPPVTAPELPAPKAIPLPPDEQDSPDEGAAVPTL
jgi:hypothetical protein